MSTAVPTHTVEFGREICGSLDAASEREWLVTNGIGGYASGTVAGLATRRYHGLLVAALQPPLGRTLLVSKLDETAHYSGRAYALAANRWAGGALDPQGYRQVERFRLEGTTPVWTFACADALLEKRVWMHAGANTTFVRHTLLRGSGPMELELKALVNYRDFHSSTRAGDWRMNITAVEHGLCVEAFEGATPFYLLSATATVQRAHEWYRDFDLAAERYRGLDDHEDHLHAGTFRARLAPGESVTLVLSAEPPTGLAADLDGRAAWQARSAQEQALLNPWAAALLQSVRQAGAPSALRLLETSSQDSGGDLAWVRQLVLAADQFIVKRPLPDEPEARSVIAGYHWFGDWGRDTMIALPGLALCTGRPDLARQILRTYARFVSCGMLPNVFPEAGQTPEYNTVDATLWFFEAVRQHYQATRDSVLLRELFPVLAEIIDWHVRGTRHRIHMDPADGLLAAGEPGVQLTWMDAKVGDWVVTPRIGKPVEVNALWYNALVGMAEFTRTFLRPTVMYEAMAKRVRYSFQRFWNEAAGCCFDVLDGPKGNDAAVRPNQIFAVSLPESPLAPEQQRAVVDTCARHLLTSHGLRSLAPEDPQYRGQYGGSPHDRDAIYHQGTVWGWLLGPFVLAHLRVYGDPVRAAAFLEPMAQQLRTHGLGTLSEIYDGDAPFTPRGCIAQAWTVAEVLRAWTACQEHRAAAAPR
ncbi:MAG: glycogen debranching enzyme family protein [Acidobacteria bacterium]|nr:glycogen debranching enzyme family protein [Acidobacteriota bacterium]